MNLNFGNHLQSPVNKPATIIETGVNNGKVCQPIECFYGLKIFNPSIHPNLLNPLNALNLLNFCPTPNHTKPFHPKYTNHLPA